MNNYKNNKKLTIFSIAVILTQSTILNSCAIIDFFKTPNILGTYEAVKYDYIIVGSVWSVTFGDNNTVVWKNPFGIGNWSGKYKFIEHNTKVEVTYTREETETKEIWDIMVIDSKVEEIYITDFPIIGNLVLYKKY